MPFLKIVCVLFAVFSILMGIQIGRIYVFSKKVDIHLQPWQKMNPQVPFKVLFAGDSTAVGTGLTDHAYSTAGYFSHDFPDADVENHSHNGLRLRGLISILQGLQDKKFDLAILQIGANDILDFTPLHEIQTDQRRVLDLTKNIAKNILILHSGDIGDAPLFIWPFTSIMKWRSLKVRDIYLASQDARVSYVDIYTRNKGHDLSTGYAKDGLHLNAQGYFWWYTYIKDQLEKMNWLPSHTIA